MKHLNLILTVTCIYFLIANIQAYQSDNSRGRSRQLMGTQRRNNIPATNQNVKPKQENLATRYSRCKYEQINMLKNNDSNTSLY